MSHDPANDRQPPVIQQRAKVPGQDPLINPGYQPVPQDLPADAEPAKRNTDESESSGKPAQNNVGGQRKGG